MIPDTVKKIIRLLVVTILLAACLETTVWSDPEQTPLSAPGPLAQKEFERGIALADAGDPAGVLWLARSVMDAPKNPIYRKAAVCWLRSFPRLFHTFDGGQSFTDGTFLLTTDTETYAQAHLWSVRTAASEGTFQVSGALAYASFNSAHTRVLTASNDGTVRVWEVPGGRPITLEMHHPDVYEAIFSPRGDRVATVSSHGARLWDASTGRPLTPLLGRPDVRLGWLADAGEYLAFSPDGSLLVTTSCADSSPRDVPGELSVWEVPSGRLRTVVSLKGRASSVAFSPDGAAILAFVKDGFHTQETDRGTDIGAVRLFSAATGKPVAQALLDSGRTRAACFSPNGLWIATDGDDGTVRIWEAATGRVHATIKRGVASAFEGHSVAFNRDSRYLLTCTPEGARVWNAESGEPASPTFLGGKSAVFSPDGAQVVVVGVSPNIEPNRSLFVQSHPTTSRVWNLATRRPLAILATPSKISYASLSADGSRLVGVSADNSVSVWDARTGVPVRTLKPDESSNEAALSPDGGRVVIGSESGNQVWDVASGRPLTPPMKTGWTPSGEATFSRDGTRIITMTQVWDASTGKPLTHPWDLDGGGGRVSYSPRGDLVAVPKRNSVDLWRTATGLAAGELHFVDSRPVSCLGFSPDGARLVVSSDQTNTPESDESNPAVVYDVASGGIVMRLEHKSVVNCAIFSGDGTRIITACNDGTVHVWDASSGAPVTLPLSMTGRVLAAALSPDGRSIVTTEALTKMNLSMLIAREAEDHGVARVWDESTLLPLTLPMPADFSNLDWANGPPFSRDGRRLLLSDRGRVWIWGVAGDDDAPPELIELTAQTWIGQTLNQAGAPVSVDDWNALCTCWVEEATNHARTCRYPDANVWLQVHPMH